jgi:hypothetical protein
VQTKVAGANNAGDRLFDVTLRRKAGAWLIDEIREK